MEAKGRLKETVKKYFFYQTRRARLIKETAPETLTKLSNPTKAVAFLIFNGRVPPGTL